MLHKIGKAVIFAGYYINSGENKMKYLVILIPFFFLAFSSCENQKIEEENVQLKKQVDELKHTISRMRSSDDKLMFLTGKLMGIKARIVTNYGNIELKFFPEVAPLQCFNFITRAESGFYDGTLFHRVIKGFMIQGGDPITKTDRVAEYGSGGPIAMIPHEFNDKEHKRGILSTARTSDVNAGAGSQFFIMHEDRPNLDHNYTVFGEVTKGMHVVDKIATSPTDKRDRPLNPVRIKTIEVYR